MRIPQLPEWSEDQGNEVVVVISIDILKYPSVHVSSPIMKLRIKESLTQRNPMCDYCKLLYNLNGPISECS